LSKICPCCFDGVVNEELGGAEEVAEEE